MMVLAPFPNWFLGELRCGLVEANGWNGQGWLQWSYGFLEGARELWRVIGWAISLGER